MPRPYCLSKYYFKKGVLPNVNGTYTYYIKENSITIYIHAWHASLFGSNVASFCPVDVKNYTYYALNGSVLHI